MKNISKKLLHSNLLLIISLTYLIHQLIHQAQARETCFAQAV